MAIFTSGTQLGKGSHHSWYEVWYDYDAFILYVELHQTLFLPWSLIKMVNECIDV